MQSDVDTPSPTFHATDMLENIKDDKLVKKIKEEQLIRKMKDQINIPKETNSIVIGNIQNGCENITQDEGKHLYRC